MFSIKHLRRRALLAGLWLGVTVPVVSAQGRGPRFDVPGRIPVAIAVTDSFPYGDANAVIVRRSTATIPDVILVRRGRLTERVVADAVRQLLAIRVLQGDTARAAAIYRVNDKGRPWVRPRESASWIPMLEQAPRASLEGVGELSHIVLYLPKAVGYVGRR